MCVCVGACAIFITEILSVLMVSTIYRLAMSNYLRSSTVLQGGFYSYVWYFIDSEVALLSVAMFQNSKHDHKSYGHVCGLICASTMHVSCPLPVVCSNSHQDDNDETDRKAPGSFGHNPIFAEGCASYPNPRHPQPPLTWLWGNCIKDKLFSFFFPVGWHIA